MNKSYVIDHQSQPNKKFIGITSNCITEQLLLMVMILSCDESNPQIGKQSSSKGKMNGLNPRLHEHKGSSCRNVCLLLVLILASTLPSSLDASSLSQIRSRRKPSVVSSEKMLPKTPPSFNSRSTLLASAVATNAPSTTTVGDDGGNKNPVVGFVSFLKNYLSKTVEGCSQLWKNHGRCNEIRSKITKHRDMLKQKWQEDIDNDLPTAPKFESEKEMNRELQKIQGGITYEEFVFLTKGKDDRTKVMNLVFLMFGAPRFLPYALWFNPDMLPNVFMSGAESGGEIETISQRRARERTSIVMQTLLDLERDAVVIPFAAKLNIFGRKQQKDRCLDKQRLIQQVGIKMAEKLPPATNAIISANTGTPTTLSPKGQGALGVLDSLHSYLYKTEIDFDRSDKRLCQVPASIISGLVQACKGVVSASGSGSGGFFSNLQPNFMTRGTVVSYCRKLQEADDFLVSASVDLKTISKRLLYEACQDRLITSGGPPTEYSREELEQSLQDWLNLTVHKPAALMKKDATKNLHYNDNLARTVLMTYYACWSVRKEPSSSGSESATSVCSLPRLLYTGGGNGSDEKAKRR